MSYMYDHTMLDHVCQALRKNHASQRCNNIPLPSRSLCSFIYLSMLTAIFSKESDDENGKILIFDNLYVQ